MRKTVLAAVLSAAAAAGAAGQACAQTGTTRIEPRPFYGATVTLEEGVRVFRPLPPTRHVIINPNRTPLALSFNDTHVYEHSTSHNYHYGEGGEAVPVYGAGGVPFAHGHRAHPRRHSRGGPFVPRGAARH